MIQAREESAGGFRQAPGHRLSGRAMEGSGGREDFCSNFTSKSSITKMVTFPENTPPHPEDRMLVGEAGASAGR